MTFETAFDIFIGVGSVIALYYCYRIATGPPLITPKDAAAALVHKSLRHLVNKCETHMTVCPYKEESMSGVVNFAKEVLSRDMASSGIMRMANLEDQIMQSQAKYNELLEAAHNPEQLKQYLIKECLCGTGSKCQKHG